jgi:4-hydroxy-tetrahydrodipicolinate synthase
MWAFFDEMGKLDEKAMRLQVRTCIETGAYGITILGLVTEMNKLSRDERQQIVEWAGNEISGRVPFAVTVPEPSIPGQIAFCHMAKDNGADWVILQPPPVKGVGEAAYVDFFGRVVEACSLPVAIQNNPFNMDVSVSNAALAQLGAQYDNL